MCMPTENSVLEFDLTLHRSRLIRASFIMLLLWALPLVKLRKRKIIVYVLLQRMRDYITDDYSVCDDTYTTILPFLLHTHVHACVVVLAADKLRCCSDI
jgi:hypothetical protein